MSRWCLPRHRLDGLGDFGAHRGPSDGGVASLMDVQFQENPRCVLHFSLCTLECKQSIFFHENRESVEGESVCKYIKSFFQAIMARLFHRIMIHGRVSNGSPKHLSVSDENRSLGDFCLSLTLAL